MDALIAPQVHEALSKNPTNDALLPLDGPERVVSYKMGGKKYRHIFRRLTAGDVEQFFANVGIEVRQEKNGVTRLTDMDSAALALYRRAAQRAEGFATRDGREPHQLPGWPECIRSNHRILAGNMLIGALADEGEQPLEAEGVSILLKAAWNEAPDGGMQEYKELVHRFASPTAEHQRKINRARNRAFVAGGSRFGTTIFPPIYTVIVALYDELIREVDGYSVHGRALTGREEIAREMDGFHKNAAINALFPVKREADPETEG